MYRLIAGLYTETAEVEQPN